MNINCDKKTSKSIQLAIVKYMKDHPFVLKHTLQDIIGHMDSHGGFVEFNLLTLISQGNITLNMDGSFTLKALKTPLDMFAEFISKDNKFCKQLYIESEKNNRKLDAIEICNAITKDIKCFYEENPSYDFIITQQDFLEMCLTMYKKGHEA